MSSEPPPLPPRHPPTLDYASRRRSGWSAEERRAWTIGCLSTLAYCAAVIAILIVADLAIHIGWSWMHD